jgi:hypothetical protein
MTLMMIVPQVTSTVPLSDAVDVDISVEITADFSVVMDPATINTNFIYRNQGFNSGFGCCFLFRKNSNISP